MKNIIKIAGKMPAIIAALKALQATHGDGATLSDVAIITRYNRIIQAEKEQFQKDGNK